MTDDALRPIAFMVMPFRKRDVPSPPAGAPTKIDCDALWDRAFRPALEDLGYLPVRADAEVGAVIVKDMLERLALADLVLADLTLPNGNVYYEVGLRHVAQRTHCVLVAADWSQQLFDVDQIRTDRYPLKDGDVPESEAEVIRRFVHEAIRSKRHSLTPYYELVKGKEDATVFREQVERISAFQAQVRAARLLRDRDARTAKVREIVDSVGEPALEMPEIALELITLVRDHLGWGELVKYIEQLPPKLHGKAFVQEQLLLARSKLGDHAAAIAGLEGLIDAQGATPEREGLLGGRYKKWWRELRKARLEAGAGEPGFDEEAKLEDAIEHYRRGMVLDYNQYFCACNLPGLLRARGNEGDAEEALFIDQLVVLSCRRAIDRNEDDGYAKPTLLGAAFRARDVREIERLIKEIAREGPAAWQLEALLDDLRDAVESVEDEATKAQLAQALARLEKLAQQS
jgi:hypothetical protein